MTNLLKNICRDVPALGSYWEDFRYSLTTKEHQGISQRRTKAFHW